MANINVLMNKDKSVMACFRKKRFTLTTAVDPIDGGTITEGGKFPINTIVPVEAIPAPDYEFDHWSGDITGKWSGLGMNLPHTQSSYFDTLLDSGFEELRITIPDWHANAGYLGDSKEQVIVAVAKGAKVVWGLTSDETVLTAANWNDFRLAVLDAAQWAQDNGVFEFQIGNEEVDHIDGTTLIWSQLIANIKSLATEVKAIFTNGNISYSCSPPAIDEWVTAGRGDIDLLASNVYYSSDDTYKNRIDMLVNGFGVDHTYLTEFNYADAPDEATQAAGITEMIEYIKASGMTRAIFFYWKDYAGGNWGVLKADGTYRWDSLLNSE